MVVARTDDGSIYVDGVELLLLVLPSANWSTRSPLPFGQGWRCCGWSWAGSSHLIRVPQRRTRGATRNGHGPAPGRVTILIVDDTSAQPSQTDARTIVVRCMSSFTALLVVFFLVPQGILDGQPEWLAVVITSLLVLGAFQLVELVDSGLRRLRSRRSA
jgi:hypothetical protein